MKHYVYRIENTQTQEYYIGVRSCKCEIEEDPYMGSSSQWTRTYIKENAQILVKQILDSFESRVNADIAEINLRLPFIDDPLCVNILFDKIPSALGKKQTEDHINKRKLFGEDNGMYNKHHTKEVKAKLSQAMLGREISEETKLKMGAWQKGVAKSEEVKAKSSASHKKKYQNGYRQPTSKPIIVEDLYEGTITEYPSNTDFCLTQGFNKQSVGVFIRKGLTYKKRWKVRYKETILEERDLTL